jgi:hypothetical protein
VLIPNEDSVETNETKTGPTEIVFPRFRGWNLWMYQYAKYTLMVTLVKEIEEN